jgi:hypothetical protein
MAYPAGFSECAVWRASGIPLNFTLVKIGIVAIENVRILVNAAT